MCITILILPPYIFNQFFALINIIKLLLKLIILPRKRCRPRSYFTNASLCEPTTRIRLRSNDIIMQCVRRLLLSVILMQDNEEVETFLLLEFPF